MSQVSREFVGVKNGCAVVSREGRGVAEKMVHFGPSP